MFRHPPTKPTAPAASAGATPGDATGSDPTAAPDLRVLVADDHPTHRHVVQLILSSVGIDVVLAEDGRQAVAAYEAGGGGLDLILMDMQMPVMDGLTAIAEIRRREQAGRSERLPILMLSANAKPEHVAAALAAGADGHVAKPVTPQQLIAAIDHALDSGDLERAAAGEG